MIKLDDALFQSLIASAIQSPRKRSHYNLHKVLDEPVQRLCIGLIKGTYVRPHHHPNSNKWELMLVLKGRVALVLFDQQGVVLEKIVLNNSESVAGVELLPATWHTVVPLTPEAVILEVKEGPYLPTDPADFAAWAPPEGDETVERFLQWLENVAIGERYTAG